MVDDKKIPMSERIGSPANLAKYAPEYEEDGLNFMHSAREIEIINYRMHKDDPKTYIIDDIQPQAMKDNQNKPYYAIMTHSSDSPNVDARIDEWTHLEDPDLMALSAGPQPTPTKKPIYLSQDKTLRFLKGIHARFSDLSIRNASAIGTRLNNLTSAPDGDVFEYQPSFKAVDNHQAPADDYMHPNIKTITDNPDYVKHMDENYHITDEWKKVSDNILDNYDTISQQNAKIPIEYQSKANDAIDNGVTIKDPIKEMHIRNQFVDQLNHGQSIQPLDKATSQQLNAQTMAQTKTTPTHHTQQPHMDILSSEATQSSPLIASIQDKLKQLNKTHPQKNAHQDTNNLNR